MFWIWFSTQIRNEMNWVLLNLSFQAYDNFFILLRAPSVCVTDSGKILWTLHQWSSDQSKKSVRWENWTGLLIYIFALAGQIRNEYKFPYKTKWNRSTHHPLYASFLLQLFDLRPELLPQPYRSNPHNRLIPVELVDVAAAARILVDFQPFLFLWQTHWIKTKNNNFKTTTHRRLIV